MPLGLFPSLSGYKPEWLRGDIVAGLTVWAVLVPEALAYASIAGVSPVVGLYAAPGALLLYAIFGSSRHLVVGPMSATAALSAAAVAQFATQGTSDFAALTVALALTAGAAAIVAGLLKLGFLASFISEPVLKGFIIGLAMTIIAGQLPKLLGVESVSGDFFEKIAGVVRQLGNISVPDFAVGTLALVIVVGLKELAPVLPGSLIAVAVGIGATIAFGLDDRGVAIVGPIAGGLPPFRLPSVALSDYAALVPSAFGIVLVGFAEGLGAAKTYASRDHYDINPDRELLGVGAANLAAGLSSGMVVNGSLSKTAVNGAAGAKSQVSGLVVAALTIVTLLFLTGLFEQLPEAVLAGVVIAAVWELIDVRSLVRLYRLSTAPFARLSGIVARPDFLGAVAALLGVLIFDTLPGLFIGITVSLLLLLYRDSRPHVATLGHIPGTREQYGDISRHPENETTPGITIIRVDGGLFFANADFVRNQIKDAVGPDTTGIVLDMETVASADVTGIHMLTELHEELRRQGIRLVVARNVGEVRDIARRELGDSAPNDAFPTVHSAVAALVAHRKADADESASNAPLETPT